MAVPIPTEVYVAVLDRSIQIHWNYHALLMTIVWLVLVPAGVFAVRFCKPKPSEYGIAKGTAKLDPKLRWWSVHYVVLYTSMALSMGGIALAVFVSGGFSGSLHGALGIGVFLFGALQLASAWCRGTHGGKYGAHSDPVDPATWRGDHFDMTPRRRWFEAYHKSAGYFSLALAFCAIASGLSQYPMPALAIGAAVLLLAILALWVIFEGKGYRQDTYQSVYGDRADHPYNRRRARR